MIVPIVTPKWATCDNQGPRVHESPSKASECREPVRRHRPRKLRPMSEAMTMQMIASQVAPVDVCTSSSRSEMSPSPTKSVIEWALSTHPEKSVIPRSPLDRRSRSGVRTSTSTPSRSASRPWPTA